MSKGKNYFNHLLQAEISKKPYLTNRYPSSVNNFTNSQKIEQPQNQPIKLSTYVRSNSINQNNTTSDLSSNKLAEEKQARKNAYLKKIEELKTFITNNLKEQPKIIQFNNLVQSLNSIVFKQQSNNSFDQLGDYSPSKCQVTQMLLQRQKKKSNQTSYNDTNTFSQEVQLIKQEKNSDMQTDKKNRRVTFSQN